MAEYNTKLTTWDVGVTIARNNPVPLDSTENQPSLSAAQQYAKNGATSYVGQVIKVVDNTSGVTGCYVIKNTTGDLLELATSDSLSTLTKAFTFKGVASAIDEDRCTITINPLKTSSGVLLSVIKQAFDFTKQTMLCWSSSDGKTVFWTTASDSNGTQYTSSDAKSTVRFYKYLDTYYFPTSTNTVWESLDGDKLYTQGDDWETDNVFTDVEQASTPIDADVERGSYDAYTFTEVTTRTELDNTYTGKPEDANPSNIGHVYQIGEEEYASNGSIWVQLGSPKEDWIVIK